MAVRTAIVKWDSSASDRRGQRSAIIASAESGLGIRPACREAFRQFQSARQVAAPWLQRLHEAILIHDPALGPTGRDERLAAPSAARNPCKGLRAFGAENAGDFSGREDLVRRLVVPAGGARLLGLIGPTGSGKSCVLSGG